MPGFPIRTSSDQRSVDSSPRHIAASHVLHRLPVPRHPPCALKHLQHKKPLQRKITPQQTTHHPDKKPRPGTHVRLDARNHYPQIKHHTPPPSGATPRLKLTEPLSPAPMHPLRFPQRDEEKAGLLPQSPIVCLAVLEVCCAPDPHPLQVTGHPTNRPGHRLAPHAAGRPGSRGAP